MVLFEEFELDFSASLALAMAITRHRHVNDAKAIRAAGSKEWWKLCPGGQ